MVQITGMVWINDMVKVTTMLLFLLCDMESVTQVLLTLVLSHLVLDLVSINRFHLDHQVSVCSVDIRRVENAAVSLKCTACLMPTSLVKPIEVVSPVKME